MLNLNKTQVGALLKFMPNDGMRENLEALHLEKYDDGWLLVATNGFILTALKTNIDESDGFTDGQFIRRSALERWYKLGNRKSRLTEEELKAIIADDYGNNDGYLEGDYLNWAEVLPQKDSTQPTERIKFNTDYLKASTDLAGDMLTWELHGTLGALTAIDENGSLYAIMPMRG